MLVCLCVCLQDYTQTTRHGSSLIVRGTLQRDDRAFLHLSNSHSVVTHRDRCYSDSDTPVRTGLRWQLNSSRGVRGVPMVLSNNEGFY